MQDTNLKKLVSRFALQNGNFIPLALRWPGMQPLRAHVNRRMSQYELAFRALRVQFSEHRNIEYETKFYGLELDCRRARAHIPLLFEGIFAWLYKVSSEYGQNMFRPVVWFAAILISSAAFLTLTAGFFDPVHIHISGRLVGEAGQWVLRRQIPLPIWDPEWSNNATPPLWIRTVTMRAVGLLIVLEIVLPAPSVGLLTVFLVSLRRRFQIE